MSGLKRLCKSFVYHDRSGLGEGIGVCTSDEQFSGCKRNGLLQIAADGRSCSLPCMLLWPGTQLLLVGYSTRSSVAQECLATSPN